MKLVVRKKGLLLASLAIFAISFVLRLIELGSKPGLSVDEAFFGLQTAKILSGDLIIGGMNGFTGPLFDYLRAPFFLFGKTIFSLRLPSAVLNSLAPVILFLFLRLRGGLSSRASAVSALALSLTPWFFLSSRIAWEVNFFPLIFFAAVFFLTSENKVVIFLGAFLVGLAVWTHSIFAAAVLPIIIIWAAFKRDNALKSAAVIALGFLSGLIPKAIQIFLGNDPGVSNRLNSWAKTREFFVGFVEFFPRILMSDALFLRQVGQVRASFGIIIAFLLAAVLAISVICLIGFKKYREIRRVGATVLALLILIFTISLIVPLVTFRYLLIPLSAAAIGFYYLLAAVFDKSAFVRILLYCQIVIFFLAILVNFLLVPLSRQVKKFSYGSIVDTNAHFMDSTDLYFCLRQSIPQDKRIVAEPFLAWPMRYYDVSRRKMHIVETQVFDQAKAGDYYLGCEGDETERLFELGQDVCRIEGFVAKEIILRR